MKLLLLLVGSCFRDGGQDSKLVDTDRSYLAQKNAFESHNLLIKYLNNDNIDVDIIINTYKTKYENDLKNWYSHSLKQILINDQLIGLENLVNNALNKFNECYSYNVYDYYDGILILRLDLFLKNEFFINFDPYSEKILFPFISWKHSFKVNNCPRVSDTLMFIPKKYLFLMIHGFYTHQSII